MIENYVFHPIRYQQHRHFWIDTKTKKSPLLLVAEHPEFAVHFNSIKGDIKYFNWTPWMVSRRDVLQQHGAGCQPNIRLSVPEFCTSHSLEFSQQENANDVKSLSD